MFFVLLRKGRAPAALIKVKNERLPQTKNLPQIWKLRTWGFWSWFVSQEMGHDEEMNQDCIGVLVLVVNVLSLWRIEKRKKLPVKGGGETFLLHLNVKRLSNAKYKKIERRRKSLAGLKTVWPNWAIYWTLDNFLKPLATNNLPKSPTLLDNFCKGINIIHFSSKIIFGQLW